MVSMSTMGQLDSALPTSMALQLRERSGELQMMPEAATQALNMIRQPDCSIGKFAEIVEQDVKLAASILSLSNSPFYSRGRPIGDIREAVVQVGFRQCQNLIQASCAMSLMQKLSGGEVKTRKAILNHSLTTAQVAVELSGVLGLNLHGEEFTAGLMHDIGRLLLHVLVPDDYSALDVSNFDERTWDSAEELQAIDTDHCIVGCMFAINNSLPDTICEAIRFHHSPERAQLSSTLALLTTAADDIANHVARGDAAYDVSGNRGLQALFESGDVRTTGTPSEAICDVVLEAVLGTVAD